MTLHNRRFSEKEYWGAFGRPNALIPLGGMGIGLLDLKWFVAGVFFLILAYYFLSRDEANLFLLRETRWRKIMQISSFVVGFISGVISYFQPSYKELILVTGLLGIFIVAKLEFRFAKKLAKKLF